MSHAAYIVALTGGIGSGKSTVAGLFAQHGIHVVDTDELAHQLTAPGGKAIEAICRKFGENAMNSHGALDRQRMRARVFEDSSARADLEAILHPMIRNEVEIAICTVQAQNSPYVLLAVPLLFETMGYRGRFSRSLAVDCPVDLQHRRVKKRSGLSTTEVDRILSAQLDRSLRLQLSDDVISNAGDVEALPAQVIRLHAGYMTFAGSTPR